MNFKTRKYTPSDYPTIAPWWTGYKDWDPIPESMLPPNGFIVECNGRPAACCWVYKTDSPIWLMEWVIADPAVRGQERAGALNQLISDVVKWSKREGAGYIFTMVQHEGLIGRLKGHPHHSFTETDRNMTHLMRKVD